MYKPNEFRRRIKPENEDERCVVLGLDKEYVTKRGRNICVWLKTVSFGRSGLTKFHQMIQTKSSNVRRRLLKTLFGKMLVFLSQLYQKFK